ncbi:LLM class flavin-dependent oxidoreductase [Nocardia sp. NPDC052278]|uniref:LLM class flavin-dependent oxidoreductase n=1 Tax=unclassified Nocardia TaxID=2637762 RepID=UPI003676C536
MKIGVLLPTREAALRGDWDARGLITFAQQAERLGFDSVWTGDSLLATPRFEPLSLLSAIAATTSAITVGTATLLAPLRHPLLAAHAIATLDHISEGRLIVGVGSGFPRPRTAAEFSAVGVPMHERAGRLVETVKLWKKLWNHTDGMPLSFEGRYWNLDALETLPVPSRRGGPPVWFAGAGPRALRTAGGVFDGWLPYPPRPEDYGSSRADLLSAAATAGRKPSALTSALYLTINLNDDPAEARAELDTYAQAYYGLPLEMVEQVQAFAYGPEEVCRQRMNLYVAEGAEHIVVRIGTLIDPLAQLERIAHALLPERTS